MHTATRRRPAQPTPAIRQVDLTGMALQHAWQSGAREVVLFAPEFRSELLLL